MKERLFQLSEQRLKNNNLSKLLNGSYNNRSLE